MAAFKVPNLSLLALLAAGCSGSTQVEQPGLITSIESFFGECDGACQNTLVVEGGSDVTLKIQTYGGGTTLSDQPGTLTTAGSQRLAGLEAALPEQLESSYGCPDCADGGAMRLTLDRSGVISTHTWEFGQPPAPLSDIDAFYADVTAALRACADHADVRADGGCTPYP